MKDDATLLQEYARDRSEAAFAELVRRHINFVYAAALRQVNGDAHLAQDVTQSVFVDTARKAGTLARHRLLAGWLFTSTRYAAAKCVRGEQRRRDREQEAQRMHGNHDDGSARLEWERVRPLLDDALAGLGEDDRAALLLRYLQDLSFGEVGARLAVSENAARMRTDRALDKLRAALARRGVTSTTGALALALTSQAAVAAPAGLASSVTGLALAGTATGGALAFMSTAKLQWSIAATVVAAGTGVGLVQDREHRRLQAELAATAMPAVAGLDNLRGENQRLALANAAAATKVTDADWNRLRDEVTALQNQAEQRERAERAARAENAQLARRTALPVSQLDQPPRAVVRRAPSYPAALREAEVPGSVLVEFVIDSTGRVADARVVTSSHQEFEATTLAALADWRFSPGLKGGRQVNTRVQQMFQYAPTSEPPPEPPAWF